MGENSRCVIEVGDDRRNCYVIVRPPREGETLINAGEIVTQIKSKGVEGEIDEAGIRKAIDNKIFKKKIATAKGSDPKLGKDGRLEPVARIFATLNESIHEFSSTGQYEKFELIHPVNAGDVVANIAPSEPGIVGADIFGNALPSIDGRPWKNRGANNEIKGAKIIATTSGRAFITQAGIDIEPLLTIDNAINKEITFDGSIKISGDAEYCALIEATGDIEIHGLASNNNLKAGRNIFVHGNIIYREEVTFE